MEPGFSWTISGATILAVIGWFATIGLFLYNRGGTDKVLQERVEGAHKKLDSISNAADAQKMAYDQYIKELGSDRQKWRDDLEREIDQRFGAINAAITIGREQMSEIRENLAKNYMTKPEISAIEKRVTDNQDRLFDRIDKLDSRLSAMQDEILRAIRKTHD